MAEYNTGEKRYKAGNNANEAYKSALERAEKCLGVTHPTRLGLALNYSVFQYEIKSDLFKAIYIC